MRPGEASIEGDIVTFSHVKWEKIDDKWKKVEYRKEYDLITDKGGEWYLAQTFKRELTDKEYFKLKLDGKT